MAGKDNQEGESTASDLGAVGHQLVGPLPTVGGSMASSQSGKRGASFIHGPLSVPSFRCQLKAQFKGRLVWVTAAAAASRGVPDLCPLAREATFKWVPAG
jgi:hypothetical protein